MRCVCCSLWAGPPIVHELERAVGTHLLGPLEVLLFSRFMPGARGWNSIRVVMFATLSIFISLLFIKATRIACRSAIS